MICVRTEILKVNFIYKMIRENFNFEMFRYKNMFRYRNNLKQAFILKHFLFYFTRFNIRYIFTCDSSPGL